MEPSRIVSVCASNTEILYSLGLGPRVVGVDRFSDYPPETASLPKVGGELDARMDRIASLKPDLVLASLSVPGMERVVEAIRTLGVNHIVLAPKSVADICRDILAVGEATGTLDRAASVAAGMKERIGRVREATRGAAEKPRVYWEWWPDPTITAGGGGWMSEVLDAAGGENIFADRREESFPVTAEEVARGTPDLLALCWCGELRGKGTPGRIMERPGWGELDAARTGRVLTLEEDLFGRPGPRIADGVEKLARALHPSLRF